MSTVHDVQGITKAALHLKFVYEQFKITVQKLHINNINLSSALVKNKNVNFI